MQGYVERLMALNGLCYLTPPTQFSVNLFLETTTVQSTTLVPTTTQMSTAKSTTPETTTTTTPEATTFTSSTTLIKSNTFWFEHRIFYCKDILIPIYNHVPYECFRSSYVMIDVESITCTHYCILFTVDLVFSATCDEMSVLRAMIVTSLGFRDAQYYIMSVFLTLYQKKLCNDSNSKLYCLLLQK